VLRGNSQAGSLCYGENSQAGSLCYGENSQAGSLCYGLRRSRLKSFKASSSEELFFFSGSDLLGAPAVVLPVTEPRAGVPVTPGLEAVAPAGTGEPWTGGRLSGFWATSAG
jgi:hypothetical protein